MKKISNFFNKHKKIFLPIIVASIIILPISLLIYAKTSNKRDFVLANYQSYISPNVQEKLSNQYGLSYDYFETTEDAKKLIKNNSADIANTTSYEVVNWAKEGLIKKLDWSKFQIGGINNANDALKLFTKPVQTILQHYDINGDGQKDNLLEYGVPYFLQDLVFAYRGKEIPELSASGINWQSTIEAITNNQEFKSSGRPKLMALDDNRTIYSIPRLIQTQSSTPTIQPQKSATINELEQTYSFLSNKLNKLGDNSIKLNSDSNSVLNEVAGNTIKGAFMFNGDAIYAGFGGDSQYEINADDFHVVKPTDTLKALDLMVLNKNISSSNESKAYQILKELNIEFNDENSLTYTNFNYVNYTPSIQSLYQYVLDNNYFDGNNSLINAYTINSVNQDSIEDPISSLVKSNLSIAWISFKNSI